MGQQIYLFDICLVKKHGHITVMKLGTIWWCNWEGIFIDALEIAGLGLFGLGGILVSSFLIYVPLEHGNGLWRVLS